jgi:hypothetical protein
MSKLVWAASFMTSSAAADTIVNNLDDAAFHDLIADITDQTEPRFGGRLLVYFPDLSSVDPAWIGEIAEHVLSYVGSDEEGDVLPDPQAGVASDE